MGQFYFLSYAANIEKEAFAGYNLLTSVTIPENCKINTVSFPDKCQIIRR